MKKFGQIHVHRFPLGPNVVASDRSVEQLFAEGFPQSGTQGNLASALLATWASASCSAGEQAMATLEMQVRIEAFVRVMDKRFPGFSDEYAAARVQIELDQEARNNSTPIART